MPRRWFFAFFVVSGFCGLVYEVVWLRLAMASFGVTTPLTSIVLSVFMGGLALGSWSAGLLARRLREQPPAVVIRLYALAELVIAGSAQVVPAVFAAGREALGAGSHEWGSGAYYAGSAAWISAALLPFCVCMGATFPLAMGALRATDPEASGRSFSHLYAANVAGATAGTLASAFVLIEALGFRGTLFVTAALNATLAALALALSLRAARPAPPPGATAASGGATTAGDGLVGGRALLALLLTGLVSMAMEVVWIRQFTPYVGNMVYSFATILALYLLATTAASLAYRRRARRQPRFTLSGAAWAAIAVAAMLPVLTADPRWGQGGLIAGAVRTILGIAPLCAALGFTTPLLLDRWSGGDPEAAGGAYALNVLGCIAGPLVAGFVLLPRLSEPWTLLLLALPLLLVGSLARPQGAGAPRGWALPAAALLMALLPVVGRTFETRFPGAEVRRDSTATVTAVGEGLHKQLLVNGIGMTELTPVTKVMAHLPLALAAQPPRSALIICFGMGTSFRSALSWGADVTAVELVPSVPALFPYFHADAPELLASPRAHVVVDDGRRFLERTSRTFDVVVVDPPPPITTAGCSLIYSREFCRAARRRLSPGGVLQQWVMGAEPVPMVACVRAVAAEFPYVRMYLSLDGYGVHVLASDHPLALDNAAELASRLPPAARRDLVEWGPEQTAEDQIARILRREIPPEVMVRGAPTTPPLVDDRPVNEYYLLRALQARRRPSAAPR